MLEELGRAAEAIEPYRGRRSSIPGLADAHFRLGVLLKTRVGSARPSSTIARRFAPGPSLPKPTAIWARSTRRKADWPRRWPATRPACAARAIWPRRTAISVRRTSRKVGWPRRWPVYDAGLALPGRSGRSASQSRLAAAAARRLRTGLARVRMAIARARRSPAAAGDSRAGKAKRWPAARC